MAIPKQAGTGYRVRFRHWQRARPFWGALLLIVAGTLVLWGPLNFLQFALLPGSTLWAAILVGGLLVAMGLIQLFAPSYALITGAVGIVLSLVSLIVALGGLGIGMLLGLAGGALGVAWKAGTAPVLPSPPSWSRSQTRPASIEKVSESNPSEHISKGRTLWSNSRTLRAQRLRRMEPQDES